MTKEQAIATWEPIMNAFGYKVSKLGEICLYAHKNTEMEKLYNFPPGSSNLLPIALKILIGAKSLDLPNVTFTCEDDNNAVLAINRDGLLNSILTDESYEPITNEYIVEAQLPSMQEIKDSKAAGIDIISETECILIQSGIKIINYDIMAFGNTEIIFNTCRLIKSIVMEENQIAKGPTLVLTLGYTIKINK